jgi:hypothetical protein
METCYDFHYIPKNYLCEFIWDANSTSTNRIFCLALEKSLKFMLKKSMKILEKYGAAVV